jgi:hypothetical protein
MVAPALKKLGLSLIEMDRDGRIVEKDEEKKD